jgi:predicted PurR-regulated permease PerM
MERRPYVTFISGLMASIGVLTGIALWNGAQRAMNVLTMVLVSFFVSAACEPAVNRLSARGWRRGVAAGLLLGGTLSVVLAAAVAIGAGTLGEMSQLRESLPGLGDELEKLMNDWFGVTVSLDGVVAKLEQVNFGAAVGDAAIKSLGVIGNVLASLLVSFYLIVDGPRLRKRLCALLPQKHQGEVLRVWDLAVEKTGGYIASKVILAAISAAVHTVLFASIGVPYAIPMGLWVGVISQVVPVIGTYLAIGLPVLLALGESSTGAAIGAVIGATIYQQIENSLLAPRLTGQAVKVHPAVGFVSVLVVAAALGPAYTLLTIPVVATVQGFITAYVKTHELIDDPRLEITAEVPVVEDRGIFDRLSRRGRENTDGGDPDAQ